MIVLVAIVQGCQLHRARRKARLLFDLLLNGMARTVVDVCPASGQRPFAVRSFVHQQYAIVAKDHAAHVHFRRGIALFHEPRLPHLFGRPPGIDLQQPPGDLRDLAVALAIVFLRSEVQAGLRQGQQPAGKVE